METFGGNFRFFSILTQVSDFRNYCQTNIGFDSIVGKRDVLRGDLEIRRTGVAASVWASRNMAVAFNRPQNELI